MTVVEQHAEFDPGRYERLESPFSIGLSVGLHVVALFWLVWHWDHEPMATSPRAGEFVVEFVELAPASQPSFAPSSRLTTTPRALTEPQSQTTTKPTEDAFPFKKRAATPLRTHRSASTLIELGPQSDSKKSSSRQSQIATAPAPSGLVAVRSEGLPDQEAKALDHPKPAYPAMARRLHQEGEVIVAVQVSAEGSVLSAVVDHTSGYSILDDAAVSSLQDWHFSAAIEHGKPVPTLVRVPINYHLNE